MKNIFSKNNFRLVPSRLGGSNLATRLRFRQDATVQRGCVANLTVGCVALLTAALARGLRLASRFVGSRFGWKNISRQGAGGNDVASRNEDQRRSLRAVAVAGCLRPATQTFVWPMRFALAAMHVLAWVTFAFITLCIFTR
jgi:hypothetical protein